MMVEVKTYCSFCFCFFFVCLFVSIKIHCEKTRGTSPSRLFYCFPGVVLLLLLLLVGWGVPVKLLYTE